MVLHYNLLVVGYLVLYKYAEASVKNCPERPKGIRDSNCLPCHVGSKADFDPTSFVPAAKKDVIHLLLAPFSNRDRRAGLAVGVLPCGRRFSKREISILTTLLQYDNPNYIIQVG